ncbi:MAG: MotA/TolQ/ExbB proton channel family protein [Victivallales bacterium]|nr:MotA/TolQ/ExbB proton channel family protein [Victivallales bacterium]
MKRLPILVIFLVHLLLVAQVETNPLDFIARIRSEIETCRTEAANVRKATEDAWKAHAARMETLRKENDELLNQLDLLKDEIADIKSENAIAARENANARIKERQLTALLPEESTSSNLPEKVTAFLAEKQSELKTLLQPPTLFPVIFKDSSGRVTNGEKISYGPLSLCFSYLDSGQLYINDDEKTLPEFHCLKQSFDRDITFPLDITGKHPELLTEPSGLVKHLRQGGLMMIPILLLGISCIIIMVLKIVEMVLHRPSMDLQALEDTAKSTHAVCDALEDELFSLAQQRLAKHGHLLFWLSVSASAAPLLGLLGTVTGMIHTFRLITFFGVGDARLLADGISEALITTEAGLCIAIPALLCHAWFNRRLRRISTELEGKITQLCNNASSIQESSPQEQP